MTPRRSPRWTALAALLAMFGLFGCGGGGGGGGDSGQTPGVTCRLSVSGQADAVGAGTDGGGPGSAGDGPGDGGPGLGQFLHALVTVEQADGTVVGQAETDNTTGLIKFVLCGYTGPVKFTVTAKANTQYFDEGANVMVAFPADAKLRAVIPRYTKNVGFTMLTEAAYQYLEAKYGADGWKDANHVVEANEAIRTIFNRALPVGMQIDDITRLPPLINAQTGANTFDSTPNGLLGTLNAGLPKAARFFNLSDPAPALSLARQLGQDLADGKLDGFSFGTPIVSDSTLSTYTYAQFAEFLNNGVSQASSNYGKPGNQDAVLKFTQVKVAAAITTSMRYITSKSPMYLLRSDGNVYYWARPDQPLKLYASGFRQLFPQSTMLGSTYDGKVYFQPTLGYSDAQLQLPPDQRIPDIVGPLIEAPAYNGTTDISTEPDLADPSFAQITRLQDGIAYVDTANGPGLYRSGNLKSSGLRSVVGVATSSMGGSGSAYFALQANGNVFAWGAGARDGIGLGLGLPPQPPGSPNPVLALPTLNSSLRDIVAISGRYFGGFAIDRNGKVWGWGFAIEPSSLLTADATNPVEVTALTPFGKIAHISCAAYNACIALSESGEAIGWGIFSNLEGGNCNGGCVTYGATRIVMPAGRRTIYIGSLNMSVFALLDDGTVVTFPTTLEKPLFLRPADAPVS